MNILDQIISWKKQEVATRKILVEAEELRDTEMFDRKCISLKAALKKQGSSGIIAEFKRKTPSKGYLNRKADVLDVTQAYAANGAAALSILTDHNFFGGNTADIVSARKNAIPILRKEFIIDAYQVTTSKAMGADAIVLIASCLSPSEVEYLAGYAQDLGLEVMLELSAIHELGHICSNIDLVGINNRNLTTFKVTVNRSLELAPGLPAHLVRVAENGIIAPHTVVQLRHAGFEGFLIGEAFMKTADPGKALGNFIEQLNK